MKAELRRLRDQFREWYAALSITEIVSNRALIQRIEVLEQRLAAMVS